MSTFSVTDWTFYDLIYFMFSERDPMERDPRPIILRFSDGKYLLHWREAVADVTELVSSETMLARVIFHEDNRLLPTFTRFTLGWEAAEYLSIENEHAEWQTRLDALMEEQT